LGLLLAASIASAADEPRKWWQSAAVSTEVGLTADQSQELEGIFQSMLPRMRAEKDELDRQERTLSRLVREATVDEASILQAVERTETARADANKTRILMLYRMYRVLTPDQREKLKAIHERNKQRKRGGTNEHARHE
jgi:Spy/CpxP family protein refolding chaperone